MSRFTRVVTIRSFSIDLRSTNDDVSTLTTDKMARDTDSFFRDIFRDADDVRATRRRSKALRLSSLLVSSRLVSSGRLTLGNVHSSFKTSTGIRGWEMRSCRSRTGRKDLVESDPRL